MSEGDSRYQKGLVGYIPGVGRSPELRTARATEEFVKQTIPQLAQSLRLRPDAQGSTTILDIDSSGFARELRPELEELNENTEMLLLAMIANGSVNEKILTTLNLSYHELQELPEQGRQAYEQRKRIVQSIEETFYALVRIEDAIHQQTSAVIGAIDLLGIQLEEHARVVETSTNRLIDKMEETNELNLWLHFERERTSQKTQKAIMNAENRKLFIEAKLLMDQGSYEIALKLLKIAHEDHHTNPRTWFALAYCYMRLGQPENAMEFVIGILAIAKKGHFKHLRQRLLEDPVFAPIKDEINNLIANE